MQLRLMSRASALAVHQADLVAAAILRIRPDAEIVRQTRVSLGDRNPHVDLSATPEKGVFTFDLSQALLDGHTDAVVHSWKDLPVEGHPGTTIAATLTRADPRDVLLVRREVVDARPGRVRVLSSSPRRVWQIERNGPRWLPWTVTSIETLPVRGNVPTRLRKLISEEGDALIVAKAAIDRLLSEGAPDDAAAEVRASLDRCRWMVLPLKEHPTAPAQGALAVEIADTRLDLRSLFAQLDDHATRRAVEDERAILAAFGGGCHEAVGATVLPRDYGRITSIRARVSGDDERESWALDPSRTPPPPAAPGAFWPRPEERDASTRRALEVSPPDDDRGWWISRAEALPHDWRPSGDRIVWAAGSRTWERLARRGVWVNGCADGLGDAEAPGVDTIAGRTMSWLRLTHDASGNDPAALATYSVETPLPEDLASRTHFFWTSGSVLRRALARFPSLASAWHASGPGRTAAALRETLGDTAPTSVWLDYDQWHRHVTS
jgi:hydroxymethylbilane synthase